jgi:predicted lipid-binding transport protein (Tim44 family)
MRSLLAGLAGALIGATLVVADAEAKRLVSARSIGVQRDVAAAPATAARQASPVAAARQPGSAPVVGTSRWLPTLGALAVGGLLGKLFGGSGFGGVFVLMILTVVAIVLLRLLGRASADPARPMQYAGLGNETVAAPPPSQAAGFNSPPPAQVAPKVPAGFDVAGFVRAAKLNFIKLQIANDVGNLDQIQEFTTPRMYDELSRDFTERAGAQRQTDLVALNAELLEVVSDGKAHSASVRFSGMMRETPGAAPVGFAEVWKLAKPVNDSSGWLLAGIQQTH